MRRRRRAGSGRERAITLDSDGAVGELGRRRGGSLKAD